MIRTFSKPETELIWLGQRSPGYPPDIQKRALDKLKILNRAKTLDDLRNLPGNRLHALKGDRVGQHSISIKQHSISINMQWRICFVWKDGNAYDVEITDYH